MSTRAPRAFLREIVVVATEVPGAADGPVEEVLDGYRRWMRYERGVRQRWARSPARVAVGSLPSARAFTMMSRSVRMALQAFLAADASRFSSVSERHSETKRSVITDERVGGSAGRP
jgi:hypothetical protein